jgi:hypothetical protein
MTGRKRRRTVSRLFGSIVNAFAERESRRKRCPCMAASPEWLRTEYERVRNPGEVPRDREFESAFLQR